ncbi:MAG TPA: cell division protein FtsQ/DivIB, partial [Acidimicrobiales bacterium]
MTVSACGPPPGPPALTTTTTAVPPPPATPPCAVAGAGAQSASSPAPDPAGSPQDLPVLTGSAEITTAATKAVRAATRQGADEVTVVALDAEGRPSLVPAPLDDAVQVALATDKTLDVVAVEAPTYADALEDASTGA